MSAAHPRRILVVCTRRIGDVLLVTPLIRSLRDAFPAARISALVFRGTEGVLAGNPDLVEVIAVPARSRWAERLAELRRLWRRYDLAVSALPSDRARIYGWAAGRRHVGTVAPGESPTKRWLLDATLEFDDSGTHTVTTGLLLAELAGAPSRPAVVPPAADGALPPGLRPPFAVLHPYPKFNYKLWREDGWIALARHLQARGLRVALTGSGEPEEVACCARIAAGCDALDLSGSLSLAQTADLLRQASLFVGPDTAVTHLAAACGIPTVALFGPSNPVKWGPWPARWQGSHSPWPTVGGGRQGNVLLLQGVGECVPCLLEGCDRHVGSFSRCLLEIPAERVIAAAEQMLAEPAGAARHD